MRIKVLEKVFTIGDIYNVAINNKISYRASGVTAPFLTNFSLYELKGEYPLMSIFKSSLSLFPKYKIYFNNERINPRREPLIFKTISFFKNSFHLQFNEDLYEFYAHKELKYSIFKNGKQVAGISQDKMSILDEDGFMMNCDNDSPKELFACFIIILDNTFRTKSNFFSGLLNINHGVLFESKPYDLSWKPK